MSDVIKKIFGGASLPENLPEELKTILSLMRHERNAFEVLAKRAEASANTAQELLQPVEDMKQAVSALEQRLSGVEAVAPRIESLSAQADLLSETCRDADSRVNETATTTVEIRNELLEMRDMLRDVVSLKNDLTGFLELSGPFQALRGDAEVLAARLTDMEQRTTHACEEHDEITRRNSAMLSQLGDLEGQVEAVHDQFEGVEEGVAHVQDTLAPLSQLVAGVPDLKRELSMVKSLGDYVRQNLPMLEQQRDAVDRAAAQFERLNELARQADRGIQQQRENAATLTQIEDKLSELSALQGELTQGCRDIRSRHQQIESQDEEKRRELKELHDKLVGEWQEAVSRFEFERESLDTVTQRVADLGATLSQAEGQFEQVEEVTETISRVESDVSHLAGHVASLADEVADLDMQAERVRALRAEIGRTDRSVTDVTARLDALRTPLVTDIENNEERAKELEATLGMLEQRSQQLGDFAERVRGVGQEIERRQRTIEDALHDLQIAQELRRDAADAAKDLRAQVSALRDALAATDERMSQVDDVFGQFETQTATLEEAHQRVARLEERLVSCESMETKVNLALEQAEQRRASVETLRSEINRLFETADSTLEGVRTIAASRDEIKEGRELIESVLSGMSDASRHVEALEERKHQITEVEEKLAHLGTLTMDIDSGLRSIEGQKAFLDQVLETARSLRFQSKQAEALIDTLREERERVLVPRLGASQNRIDRPVASPEENDQLPPMELVTG